MDDEVNEESYKPLTFVSRNYIILRINRDSSSWNFQKLFGTRTKNLTKVFDLFQ